MFSGVKQNWLPATVSGHSRSSTLKLASGLELAFLLDVAAEFFQCLLAGLCDGVGGFYLMSPGEKQEDACNL